MKKIDLSETASLLQCADHILILTHRNPDGDTLGSGFALMHALHVLGKNAAVACGDDIPHKYSYMFGDEETFSPSYIVAVDVADPKLLGDKFSEMYGNKVNLCIDHHVSNVEYADNLYLRECAATCEIIYDLINALGVEIDKKMADCLYTGVSTDTGCFLFSNVTPYTHRVAAALIEKGADYVYINKIMFETKSKGYFVLEALILNTLEMFFDGKCAVMTITQDMFRKSGTDESECDGIAGIPRKIEGVLVGITFRERQDGSFKISLRSHAPVDSAQICQQLGGGGHARAAGCDTSIDNLADTKAKLLDIIKAELEKI